MMKHYAIGVGTLPRLLWAVFLLCGCTAASMPAGRQAAQLPLETLWAGNQSRHTASRPEILYLTEPAQLNAKARSDLNRAALPIIERHRMDWRREAVVWLFMGGKTTGGYSLSLASPAAGVFNDTAIITVRWHEPARGAIVTQQLTSPCLIFKLPKGAYNKIEIRDQTGRVRFQLATTGD